MAIVGLRPQPVSDPEPQSPENLRGLVQDRLAETAPSSDGLLALAAREALLGPGKRVRPVVAMLAAAHVGGRAEDALDFGCAVEMAHAASLVLDDLPCMDDAALRRGQPTLHRRHGEDAAVLAAVALLNQSTRLILQSRAPAEAGEDSSAVLVMAVSRWATQVVADTPASPDGRREGGEL